MVDYHDFVFKDGKLVGQFEDMYKKSTTVPWAQDQQEEWLDVGLAIQMMRESGPFGEIHDYGSGLGYFLDILVRALGGANVSGYGYDVSPSACGEAGSLCPNLCFEVLDLREPVEPENEELGAGSCTEGRTDRLHVIRGTLWYVFPQITNVLANIRRRMVSGEMLCVVQNFPPLDSEFVGKDMLPNPSALRDLLEPQFRESRTLWLEDHQSQGNDNWFIGLFEAR